MYKTRIRKIKDRHELKRLRAEWKDEKQKCIKTLETPAVTTCERGDRQGAWSALCYAKKQLKLLRWGKIEETVCYCDFCENKILDDDRKTIHSSNDCFEVCGKCHKSLNEKISEIIRRNLTKTLTTPQRNIIRDDH